MADPTDPTKKEVSKTISEEDFERLLTLKFPDGEETVTLKEVVARAQKKGYAERLVQAQKDKEREFETELDVARNLKEGLDSQNPELLKKAFKGAGADEAALALIFGDPNATPAPSGRGVDLDDVDSDDEIVGQMQALQAELDKLKKERDSEKSEAQKKQVLAAVAKAVDEHPELSKMKGKLKSERARTRFDRDAYLAVVEAMETLPWGPRAIKKGLEILQADLAEESKALGGEDTLDEKGEEQIPGITGFGPSGLTASRVHQATEKRVSVRDENYAMNIAARLAKLKGLIPGKRKQA